MTNEKAVEQKTVRLEALDQNRQRRIAVRFLYDSELIDKAKSIGAQCALLNAHYLLLIHPRHRGA